MDVSSDRLLLVRVEGMHCFQCEEKIARHVRHGAGVHEIEVDFPSGQASVLFDPELVKLDELLGRVERAGYHVAGHTLVEMSQVSDGRRE